MLPSIRNLLILSIIDPYISVTNPQIIPKDRNKTFRNTVNWI